MKILDIPRSGSYAGVTSSRNRFGQYVRSRVSPVNPNTTAQSRVRSVFAAYSGGWRQLDATDQAAWRALAAQLPRSDSLGQVYYLTGHQLFVSANAVLEYLGKAPIVTAPATPAWGEIPVTGAAVSGGAATLAHGIISAEEEVMLFASPPRSAGRTYESDYRFLAVVSPKTAGDFSWTTPYYQKFGAVADGAAVHLRAVLAKSASGLQGPSWAGTVVWEN